MNYKRSLIGAVVLGVAVFAWGLSSKYVRLRDVIIGPLHNHDEPVIIEEGSVRVNFDYKNDTGTDPGTPILDDEYIRRSEAEAVVRVRIWVNGTPFYCDQSTKKCLVDGGALRLTTNQNANQNKIHFFWNDNGKGLGMSSPGQKFRRVNTTDQGLFSSVDSALRVNSILLKQKQGGWSEYNLRTADSDKVVIHLCFWDDVKHCEDYKPN